MIWELNLHSAVEIKRVPNAGEGGAQPIFATHLPQFRPQIPCLLARVAGFPSWSRFSVCKLTKGVRSPTDSGAPSHLKLHLVEY